MSQLYDSDDQIGLAFPLRFGEDGQLMGCTYEEHIKQSIRTLLLTARNQRIMRRNFGSRLGNYLFENIDETTTTLAKNEIIDTIRHYEPRIEVSDVLVRGGQAPGVISVEIFYRITTTGAADRYALTIGRR